MAKQKNGGGSGKSDSGKSDSGKSGSASNPASKPVLWQDTPEDHDYPAAASYLALVADADTVQQVVDALKAAQTVHFKAKDILRASRLTLLPTDNAHVASDLRKVAGGQPLSPVLLVRGDLHTGRPAQIADGYHRVCASYYTDENTDVPVRIADVSLRDAR